MALFAAYADESTKTNEKQTEGDETWLKNSSFNIVPTTSSSEKKRRHHHPHKKSKKKLKPDIEIPKVPDEFTIDTTRSKELLTIPTISRPAAPKYRIGFYLTKINRYRKYNRKFKRYYRQEIELQVEEKLTKSNLENATEKDPHYTGFKQETELSQTTAKFNKKLTDDPRDVKTWIEYINFQDTVYLFEKSYKKGSIAKAQRVLAERKLAILDRALSYNIQSEALQRERLHVAVSTFPADELQQHLKQLIDKDQDNLILWQGYIEATQCSMSHCNTPAVLGLYTRCLSTLHQLRRIATIEKSLLEESILRMLYQAGLFLKQAGLFEQLWTLLRLYLELNLSNSFNLSTIFNEANLVELEDVVLKSELPIHELWLRIEKLREACHWLPFEGSCEDPQRIVLIEDVSELIHPITMPENVFKLTATVLSLLKVPLLPCRHTVMQELGLDYVPWALDSIEPLLSVFYPLYPIDLTNNYLLNDNKLAIGPQYLKLLPGQIEYLDFVLKIMQICTISLKGNDRTAVTIWWMRFQRLLLILNKIKRFKMPQNFKKTVKNNIKQLLKTEEHRNNPLFYREYALIEFNLTNAENCKNILKTTMETLKPDRKFVGKSWTEKQTIYCNLIRTQLELEIQENNYEEAKKILEDFNERNFKLLTLQILEEIGDNYKIQEFLPNFPVDFLILHGWFIYLHKGAIEAGCYIETVLEKINCDLFKELLYEFYVAVLFRYCQGSPGQGVFKILDDVLYKAIELFPNNLFLLGVIAKEQSMIIGSLGRQWWTLKEILLKTGRAYSILFAAFIGGIKMAQLEENIADTVTGEKFTVDTSLKNQMLALFKRITRADICTRRCGLVWRLYLQFVHNYFDSNLCRNVYYSAAEECPWMKALYIDAAIYIPAELAQIQDLIIEKQLRLHVTPEELDVLRN